MATYIQKGDAINYKNEGSDTIKYGDVVVLTDRIGIAACDIPVGENGAISLTGVYEEAAENTAAFTAGQQLYWNATDKKLTATKAESGAILAGIAIEAKATAGTKVLFRL
ncbi:DUF2190 family protein [Anaerotruncus sp. AF02-27]|uniref:DUF2190 family protein n=1 Tax=Anaerotruncus sp. AF02-27 TaxID=2292191 RepID=UPI000E4A4B17|nr:DUF2190 family protein [Anaerotruncus sp. AF02-27]RGX53824.1 DUF2190 family protein [Anaerotruncus sp. AF02-27]